MPFKSKAQMRLFFAKERRGELPKGKAKEWAKETKSISSLPERKSKKKTSKKASDVMQDALLDALITNQFDKACLLISFLQRNSR